MRSRLRCFPSLLIACRHLQTQAWDDPVWAPCIILFFHTPGSESPGLTFMGSPFQSRTTCASCDHVWVPCPPTLMSCPSSSCARISAGVLAFFFFGCKRKQTACKRHAQCHVAAASILSCMPAASYCSMPAAVHASPCLKPRLGLQAQDSTIIRWLAA